MHPILSICIPSRNMANVIGETLESIRYEIPFIPKDSIEVLVLDNCSTDNTKEIINKWQEKYPEMNIKYFKTDRSEEIGWMLSNIADYSTAPYSWIIGDDLVEKGAINKIISRISDNKLNFLILKVSWYDDFLSNFHHEIKTDPIFQVNPAIGKIHTSFFHFIGGLVFRKELNKTMKENSKNFYPHCFAVYKHLNSDFAIDYTMSFIKARANQKYRSVPLRLLKTVFDGVNCVIINKYYFRSNQEFNEYLKKDFRNPYKIAFINARYMKNRLIFLKYYFENAPWRKYYYLPQALLYCSPFFVFYPIYSILNLINSSRIFLISLFRPIRDFVQEINFIKNLSDDEISRQTDQSYKKSSIELSKKE